MANSEPFVPQTLSPAPKIQVMYCLGLRGEEEVTRLRMLNWAEEIFDEKMLDSTKMDLLDPAEEEEEEAADQ